MEASPDALSAWPAPAKLNLYLHVTGRRADGYHELSTAFQFLDFGDRLWFAPRDDGEFRLHDPVPGVAVEDDLVARAVRSLECAAGRSLGMDVRRDKRIPVGGGLGGASSDAATTLVAVNALAGLGLDGERLAALALELGADVPVFVRGAAAHALGVGERLFAAEFPEPWYVVIHPAVSVSTAAIFAAPELTRDSEPAKMSAFSLDEARNDCEPVVRRRYPEIARALDWLRDRGPARLTGTGSCVFTWRDGRDAAAALAAEVPGPWRAIVARGRNRSPLRERLRRERGNVGA
ncbi:MAG TPA: 4-(cytidine 5'-diphospho)-2-C-methyl-D-erythritol kinase [Gammaproteobacteria bacterium]|nr:4-(cytidine 5'-diphospho)-2-C-methyl-D-erythritol kinase [Gammaproteobacteria bacterium]